MMFDEAASLLKKELLPCYRKGSVVSASNIQDRIRIEQPDSERKMSVWTEFSPVFFEALKITGPMRT